MVRLRRLHLRRFFLRSHFDLAFVVGVKVGAAGDRVKVFVGGVIVIVAIAEVLVVGVLVVLVGVVGVVVLVVLLLFLFWVLALLNIACHAAACSRL